MRTKTEKKRTAHANMTSSYTAGGAPLSRDRVGRVAWLLKFPEIWDRVPCEREDMTDLGRAQLVKLETLMAAAGLYSGKANDVAARHWSIRVLIGEARKRLALSEREAALTTS